METLGFVPPNINRFAPADGPVLNRTAFTFQSGYEATKPKNRRAAPTGIVRSEDAELPPTARRALVSANRDLHRNFAVVSWAIRKHLDYVTSFTFRSKTGNATLDAVINAAVAKASAKENFDVAGRHSLSRALRMSEARRVIDGDIVWLKLNSGQTQVIEGDRIRTPYTGLPENISPSMVNHGVYTNDAGKAIAYVCCKRSKTSDVGYSGQDMQFERMLQSRWAYLHACWDASNRFDQVRGISPLASAYNAFRDVYENIEYANAKAKVAQLFGLLIKRGGAPEEGVIGASGNGIADSTVDAQSTDDSDDYPEVNFGGGPIQLNLDAADDAKVLESQTPSTQFQEFIPLVLQIGLKALDIPYSFYDESHTNYSGQRQAWILYDKSARSKRCDNRELLDDWTRWRLGLLVDDGELVLPAGVTVADLKWQWRPMGTPWIDPLKEVLASVAELEAGLDSPQAIADSTGDRDAFEIIEERRAWLEANRKAGLPDPAWITPKPTGGTGTAGGTDSNDTTEAGGDARNAAMAYLKTLPPELEKTK